MINIFEFEESEKDLKRDLLEIAWIVIWGVIVIFAGFFALTRGRGLEESTYFIKFTLFGVMIVAFLIFAVILKLVQRAGYLKNFYVPIFDPEKGILPIKSGLKFLLITLLVIITIAFLLSFKPQSSLSNFIFPLEVGGVEQQVTKGAKILFGIYNSPAENSFLYILLSILVTIEFIVMSKLTGMQKKAIFLIFLIPNIVIGSVGWLEIHDLVSRDNSLKEFSHLTFGAVMSASTLLTGTIIIPEVLHVVNNLFITIKLQLGQTWLTIIFLASFLILITATIALFVIKKKNDLLPK